ncbi:MAG: carbohydrate kinase [Paenibacillaceae bacterium]|nr:carbohydrate kinase [Paenibacillaceae bacterium]
MNEHDAIVLSLGELLVDFIPTENGASLSEVPTFHRRAGGAPANVAAAIARLGGAARFVSKVGRDAFGDFLIRTLHDEGVDCTHIVRTDEALTGLAFVHLRDDGERDFLFYRNPAADMLLRPSDVRDDVLDDVRIVHFGSVSLAAQESRAAIEHVLRIARLRGLIVSFDTNIRLSLWSNPDEAVQSTRDACRVAHIVKASDEEVAYLTGASSCAEGAAQLLALGPTLVIVTHGADGCTMYTGDHCWHVPGFRVHVVDTTGAGDAFVGGFLYALAGQIDIHALQDFVADAHAMRGAARFANAVAARTTTERGAIHALPTLQSVEALLASGGAQ